MWFRGDFGRIWRVKGDFDQGEKKGKMESSAEVQGENKGLLEHNSSSSVRLIDSRTTEGNNQRVGNM